MKLEEQIRQLLWDAPWQYGNRTQALVGLLAVPDNGYAWQDGELVSVSPGSPRHLPAMDFPAALDLHATHDLGPSPQSLQVYGQFAQATSRLKRARHVRGNIDWLSRQAPVPQLVPPDFMNGPLGDIPDNIREDWLLGVLELLLLILRMDPDFATRSQRNRDQIDAAAALLPTLLRRFASRVAFAPPPAVAVATVPLADA